jgi:hypothetical protein
MLFTVSSVSEVQAQSPTAAKLKLGKVGIEEEAIHCIMLDDKITITTIVISKETGVDIGEDIFLSDIPFSSSIPILTIFAVLIYYFSFATENNTIISKVYLHRYKLIFNLYNLMW